METLVEVYDYKSYKHELNTDQSTPRLTVEFKLTEAHFD